jgi:hypothetical protein
MDVACTFIEGIWFGRMFMAPLYDRAMLIEALRRATHELAACHSNIAEAAGLRAQVAVLLGTLGERPSISRRGEHGSTPAPICWANDAGEGPTSSLHPAL